MVNIRFKESLENLRADELAIRELDSKTGAIDDLNASWAALWIERISHPLAQVTRSVPALHIKARCDEAGRG